VDDLILSYSPPDFYLNLESMRRLNLNRKDLEATAIKALLGTSLVAKVYTADDLTSTQASPDSYLTLFRNAFFEPRSPQLTVLLKPYIYLNSLPGGTGHGTVYDYDRHVPIVFMGSAVKSGSYNADCGPEDIAPTLGLILGLDFPREPDSRLLREMLPGS